MAPEPTSSPSPRFPHAQVCDLVGQQVAAFADLVLGAPLDTPVPSCPGWDVRKLVRHTGQIHRWATALVAAQASERIDPRTLPRDLPDDDEWAEWLAAGGVALVDTLRPASPNEPMWAWGADQHVRFWPRRQLHETAVHRLDAALALGAPVELAAEVAADGITEFLDNLASAAYFSPAVAQLAGTGAIAFRATDTGDTWRVDLRPDGFTAGHGSADGAEAVATGTALDLLLVLYRRRTPAGADVSVTGDQDRVTWWLDHSALE